MRSFDHGSDEEQAAGGATAPSKDQLLCAFWFLQSWWVRSIIRSTVSMDSRAILKVDMGLDIGVMLESGLPVILIVA